MTIHIQETDLFIPVEKYFLKKGYEVHGEVNDCDVVAIKKEEMIIIELKKTLRLDVVIQATKRQKLTEDVYIAIVAPKISIHARKNRDLKHMLRRLEIGILTVDFTKDEPLIEEVLSPTPFNRKKSMRQSEKRKHKLLQEIAGRHKNMNVGGSHQKEIMTAYKEMSIYIAYVLHTYGPLSAKQLRAFGTNERTYNILYNNYYGWFSRVSRGVYELTSLGKKEYQQYEQVVRYYASREDKMNEESYVRK